ncbi:MAG TPA: VIT1/CCC1 transporter family protein [Candidatus Omnitrophota bacterium]|nr:VIT1/CCC1 transporter family protein [Candidatus Omnitrophota bacterium]
MDEKTVSKLLQFQKSELTEHVIYAKLSASPKSGKNREVLEKISREELKHYQFWKQITRRDIAPDRFKIWFYVSIARVFGLTFGLKLMEQDEEKAQDSYEEIASLIPDANIVYRDEVEHEKQILNMIDEEMLRYLSSAVLGLNDALVEFTGALAGFTLALQNSRTIAIAGLITGIAASLSMAASEYFSTKSEEGSGKNPIKASFYTGVAYVFTVSALVAPFLLIGQIFWALGLSILAAVLIILAFTFYISVAKDLPFKKRFLEMVTISLGVAALSFGIGYLVRLALHV